MAYLILPSRLTRQPQTFVRPDGYWLARGLVRAAIGSLAVDPVSLKGVTRSALAGSRDGLVATANGASNPFAYGLYAAGDYYRLVAGSSFTLVAGVPSLALVGGNPGIWREGGSNTGTTFTIVQGAGANRPWIRVNGADVLKPGTGPQLVAGSQANLVFRVTSSVEAAVFWGGAKQHSATHSTATAQSDFFMFGWQSDAGQYVGSLSCVLLFNSALSDGEAQSLSINPWQVFAPVRRIYFGAGGGTTTDAAIAGTQATDVAAIAVEATTGAAIAGAQATDVAAITVEATTGAALAGTQATDVAAVTVEATTGAAIAGTQDSDVAALVVDSEVGTTTCAIGGTQAPDVAAIDVEATLGLALSATQASDLGYIVVEATLPASMAGTQASDVAAIAVSTGGIWTDVGVSAATWSDVGAASSIWTDL